MSEQEQVKQLLQHLERAAEHDPQDVLRLLTYGVLEYQSKQESRRHKPLEDWFPKEEGPEYDLLDRWVVSWGRRTD